MNKKLEADLTKTMEICIDIMLGHHFHCTQAEMKCIPSYLCVKTKTQAKKQGLELKRGAKRIGTMEWHIPSGGKAYGDLYLGLSFKENQNKKQQLSDNTEIYNKYLDQAKRAMELEQEVNQLKQELLMLDCEDVDIIRCLKSLAYEHNHSEILMHKDLAKRTMEKYVERCTSAKKKLAEHDIKLIEKFSDDLKGHIPKCATNIELIMKRHIRDLGQKVPEDL